MENLRKVQLCQLDLALELKKICDENNIKYFLVGGTLLGAARHKGFIPWDDDLDIGMLRSDYEKFIDICINKNKLNKKYFLQNWNNDSNYGLGFSKLRIRNTKYTEYVSKNTKAENGIYIDIFPYDFAGNTVKETKKNINLVYFWSRLFLYKKGYISWKKSFVRNGLIFIFKLISKCYSDDFIKHKVDLITCSGDTQSEVAISYFGCYKEKDIISMNDLLNCEELMFEGTMFSVPRNYHKVLSNIYGDYMKLPPIEQRGNRHNILELDFSSYEILNLEREGK